MNENTVFVLGAGFSKEAGYPLTHEFTSKKTINQLRKNLKKKSELQRLDKVTHYFLDRIKNKYCENNIESILNHVSVADYLFMESQTEVKTKTYSSSDIFNDLLWYIVSVLELNSKKKIPIEYYTFVRKCIKNQHTIISFNYDLVLETILNNIGITCDYGINQKRIKKSLIVLKMHGSVNWSHCRLCDYFAFFSDYAASRILSKKEKCPQCNKNGLQTILIPPILYKEYKNSEYETLVRMLWGEANEVLYKAKKIVFIGFSMAKTDSYAQELFKLSSNMNINPDTICWIITKPKKPNEVSSLKKRYRSVLVGDKINFKQEKFTDFVKKHMKSSR